MWRKPLEWRPRRRRGGGEFWVKDSDIEVPLSHVRTRTHTRDMHDCRTTFCRSWRPAWRTWVLAQLWVPQPRSSSASLRVGPQSSPCLRHVHTLSSPTRSAQSTGSTAPPRRGRTALIREHARGQARQGRVLACRATGLVGARAVVGRIAACIRSCPLLRERRDRWRSWFHFLLYPLSYSKGSTPSRAIYEFTQN